MSKNEYLYDLRVVNTNIKQGKISKKNYSSFIKKLPDVSEKSEILVIEDDDYAEDEQLEDTTDDKDESNQ